jgi:deoxyribodipyrimidine photo-lyase
MSFQTLMFYLNGPGKYLTRTIHVSYCLEGKQSHMQSDQTFSIFWFRRDLRFFDNKGLYHALKENENVIPLFIFDTEIIENLPENDARVEFIHNQLVEMHNQLRLLQRSFWVYKGAPVEMFQEILKKYQINAVYTNKDHEPYGIARDEKIEKLLKEKGIGFYQYLDHLLFDKNEVLKDDGTPYHVYTPYGKKCQKTISQEHFRKYKSETLLTRFTPETSPPFKSLNDLGFKPSGIEFPSDQNKEKIILNYHDTRDFPAQNGTTRLGVHLRFGTISLRQLAQNDNNETFFNELLWREFYAMILWHYPRVINQSFKPAYDKIEWLNDPKNFELWKQGKTGYPLVDAGMRQLAETGYMHNRVRMVTASFLTKHLLIDWRWGEAWFAEKLLDYELSSNNGGWQWSAGSGCDAAPYFRIFNPIEQQKKFDANGKYIKKWVSEFDSMNYPTPIIDHKEARERCLRVYKQALNS